MVKNKSTKMVKKKSIDVGIQTMYRKLSNKESSATNTPREFWKKQKMLLSPDDLVKAKSEHKTRLLREKRQAERANGINSRGGLVKRPDYTGRFVPVKATGPVTLKADLKSVFSVNFDYLPAAEIGNISNETLIELQRVEELLKGKFDNPALRVRGGAAKKDARDSNYGRSLGRTTVSGGSYAKKQLGVSGSIHLNKHLVDDTSLQQSVWDIAGKVVQEAFGHKGWYQKALLDLSEIPKTHLLPGGMIPGSHIWRTRDPKANHVHRDINTVGPAFVFCPNHVTGGELLVQYSSRLPDGGVDLYHKKIHLSPGVILGGAWAQNPHCNLKVQDGKQRHSWVIYLDYRHLSSRYVVKSKK
jgi:hypothetical protein